jgi:hypothetical protein
MAKASTAPEDALELKRLYQDYVAAVNRAGVTLVSKGMDSPEFSEANKSAEAVHQRIRAILDSSGSIERTNTEAVEVAATPEQGNGAADSHREGQLPFACVYVEARPKGGREGTPIDDYVVEDDADHELATFKKQHEAIEWAKKNGHSPLVARVRHRNDKKRPEYWRSA